MKVQNIIRLGTTTGITGTKHRDDEEDRQSGKIHEK